VRRFLAGLLLLVAIHAGGDARAEAGEYLTREAFLEAALATAEPASDVVWLDEALRNRAADILGHDPGMLRARYWYAAGRTAWVFDEIGKERPITMGVVIENGTIRDFRVLTFRESRGWEIRYAFFTRQFDGLGLDRDGELDATIDSISGATLSVRAARRVANLALVFDDVARRTNTEIASAR